MKVIEIEEASIKECAKEAQHERVVLTRRGKPIAVIAGVAGMDLEQIAVIAGVAGMDLEQIALGHSDAFWQLIRARRDQKTVGRAELEKRLAEP